MVINQIGATKLGLARPSFFDFFGDIDVDEFSKLNIGWLLTLGCDKIRLDNEETLKLRDGLLLLKDDKEKDDDDDDDNVDDDDDDNVDDNDDDDKEVKNDEDDEDNVGDNVEDVVVDASRSS